MKESIFNKPIKDIAKLLVQVTNKDIKQIEALNLLAKLDGFSSYENYKDSLNYEKNITDSLDLEIKKLSLLWEELRINRAIGNEYAYIEKLIHTIESFFIFKDNSKILIKNITIDGFPDDIEIYCIYKKLLDINTTYLRNRNRIIDSLDFIPKQIEEDKVYETLEDGIIQEQSFILPNNMSFNDFIFNKHPSKAINWFKEYFDLKYSGYIDSKNALNTLINDFSSNIKVNIKTSFKEQLSTLEEIEKYLIDIDYEILEHKLKIRLSYNLSKDEMIEVLYSPLFLNSESDIKKYIEEEFKNIDSNVNNTISRIYDYNNYFAIGLKGVQVIKIDEEFETSISDFDNMKEKDFEMFMGLSNITQTLTNPVYAHHNCVNELTKHILKKHSLSKFMHIENCIINNPQLDKLEYKFDCFDEDEFNVNKDLVFSTYKYVFETLNNELVYLMNKTIKDLYINILVNFEEQIQNINTIIRTAVQKVNDMKIDEVNNAVAELKKQLKDYENIVEVEPDSIKDLSGTVHPILITKDKKGFTYLMLYYKKENECFEFHETEFHIPYFGEDKID